MFRSENFVNFFRQAGIFFLKYWALKGKWKGKAFKWNKGVGMSLNRHEKLILAMVFAILFAIAGCGGEQDGPPSPGVIVDFTNITPTSLTVNWTKATDDNTLQPYLEYKVVYQIFDVIGTVDAALQSGRGVSVVIENADGEEEEITWVQDNTSIDVKDLDDGIEYYFNVVVRDKYWNAAAYTPVTCKTVDITAPEPGNAGLLEISDETRDSDSMALTLSWTKASDNNTSGPDVLEYRVVFSTSNNIGSVDSALDNDMTPEDKQVWTTDINTTLSIADGYITGLPYATCHYFNVLVRDEAGNTATYQTLSQTPEAGEDGLLTISDEGTDSLRLNWAKATDSENDASLIDYRVVYSASDNINSIEDAEANDEADFGWQRDIDYKDISLPSDGNYFFNVLVRDIAGIKTIYKAITNAPLPSGGLSISDAQPESLTLSWSPAEDNGSDASTLSYKVAQSSDDNIQTVEEIETLGNGSVIKDWTNNLETIDITGLDAGTDYYFNVLVRDATGHLAAYGSIQSSASSREETEALSRMFAMVLQSASNSDETPQTQTRPDGPFIADVADELVGNTPLFMDNRAGDLMLWLAGSDVLGNGGLFEGRVGEWRDKSGYANNALQAEFDRMPMVVANPALANKPVVRFDKERGDAMTVDFSNMSNLSADYTIIVAANVQNAISDEASGVGYFECIDAEGNAMRLERACKTGGFVETFEVFGSSTGLRQLTIGTPAASASSESQPSYVSADIAEFIVFDRTLTDVEHERLVSYLAEKWGVGR